MAMARMYMHLVGFAVVFGGYHSGVMVIDLTEQLRSTFLAAEVLITGSPVVDSQQKTESFASEPESIILDDGIRIPPTCSKYFDMNFPINLTRVADFHLQSDEQRDWRSRPFTRQEIMRPPCGAAMNGTDPYSTIILVKNNDIYYHKSKPLEDLHFRSRVGFLHRHFQSLQDAFPGHRLPDMMFKWWSIDNPIVANGCTEGGNVFGTVSYSHCPRPYCSMGIAIPVSHSPESAAGRLFLDKTASTLMKCSNHKFRDRLAQGEWHGSKTGHVPMNFWNSPNPDFNPPCSLAMSTLTNDKKCDSLDSKWDPSFQSGYTLKTTVREAFLEYLSGSPNLIANNVKKDMCEMFQTNRILYSIAGGSYASNFIDNLMSGALVVKQNYPTWSFLEPYFEPNKHYLLVRRDLADVRELSDYVLSLDSKRNPTEFQRIAKVAMAGRDRALFLARESPLMNQCLFLYLFRRYAEMLDPQATDFEPNEWIKLEEYMWKA